LKFLHLDQMHTTWFSVGLDITKTRSNLSKPSFGWRVCHILHFYVFHLYWIYNKILVSYNCAYLVHENLQRSFVGSSMMQWLWSISKITMTSFRACFTAYIEQQILCSKERRSSKTWDHFREGYSKRPAYEKLQTMISPCGHISKKW